MQLLQSIRGISAENLLLSVVVSFRIFKLHLVVSIGNLQRLIRFSHYKINKFSVKKYSEQFAVNKCVFSIYRLFAVAFGIHFTNAFLNGDKTEQHEQGVLLHLSAHQYDMYARSLPTFQCSCLLARKQTVLLYSLFLCISSYFSYHMQKRWLLKCQQIPYHRIMQKLPNNVLGYWVLFAFAKA